MFFTNGGHTASRSCCISTVNQLPDGSLCVPLSVQLTSMFEPILTRWDMSNIKLGRLLVNAANWPAWTVNLLHAYTLYALCASKDTMHNFKHQHFQLFVLSNLAMLRVITGHLCK